MKGFIYHMYSAIRCFNNFLQGNWKWGLNKEMCPLKYQFIGWHHGWCAQDGNLEIWSFFIKKQSQVQKLLEKAMRWKWKSTPSLLRNIWWQKLACKPEIEWKGKKFILGSPFLTEISFKSLAYLKNKIL